MLTGIHSSISGYMGLSFSHSELPLIKRQQVDVA